VRREAIVQPPALAIGGALAVEIVTIAINELQATSALRSLSSKSGSFRERVAVEFIPRWARHSEVRTLGLKIKILTLEHIADIRIKGLWHQRPPPFLLLLSP
jgi:hypothetical protein